MRSPVTQFSLSFSLFLIFFFQKKTQQRRREATQFNSYWHLPNNSICRKIRLNTFHVVLKQAIELFYVALRILVHKINNRKKQRAKWQKSDLI